MTLTPEQRRDRVRWVLTLIFMALLLWGLYVVLRPFLVPLAWSAILVATTWPIRKAIARLLPGRPYMVAGLMTFLLALVLVAAVVPLLMKGASELEIFARDLTSWLRDEHNAVPSALSSLPWIGPRIESLLLAYREERLRTVEFLSQYREPLFEFATKAAQGVIGILLKLLMCIFASFFFYLHGAAFADQVARGLHQIGGERFDRLLEAIRGTVRGAVYGVVATALAQGCLAGIGFFVFGAPVPLLLGFATVVMSFIPFGTPFVYVPVSIYLATAGASPIAGVLLLAWGVGVVSTVDNFLRPFFISQATQLPILVVFIGAIGGVLSFGLIGIFVGPALMAVAQVLWHEWTAPQIQHAKS